MAKSADTGSKRLISLAPDAWVKWVMQSQDIEFREILDSGFQWLSRESDVVVKVSHAQHGEFLILNEIQLEYRGQMPLRMRAYAALAQEKYNLPVYPVLINIKRPPSGVVIPTRYQSNFLGLEARQDYRVINLWEIEAEIAFQESILLPFVPVMKGGGSEPMVRRALKVLESDRQLSELKNLLAYFATFMLSVPMIEDIMNWDVAALRVTPWYAEILKEEARNILMRLLRVRFGEVPEQVKLTLEGLNVEQLESLGEVVVTANSFEEFVSAIPPVTEDELAN